MKAAVAGHLRTIVVVMLFGVTCLSCRSSRDELPRGQSTVLREITPLIRLSGSNTIGAELGPALAEAFLASRGVTNHHRENLAKENEIRVVGDSANGPVSIEIRAHGTTTAFPDLADGKCDIAMASRDIKPDEIKRIEGKGLGDPTSHANDRVIGLDGIAVIVHETSDVSSMNVDDLAAAFTGQSTDRKWHVYARDKNSGTFDLFNSKVLRGRPLASGAKRIEDSRALASAVAQDPEGIGFIGLPYAVGVKKLLVGVMGAQPLPPDIFYIKRESYPLSRRLHFYLTDRASRDARGFAEFAYAHQDMVERAGFVRLEVVSGDRKAVRASVQGMQGTPLSEVFFFKPGSRLLDSKAIDGVGRVVKYLGQQNTPRVGLVGFADNAGDKEKNVKLSRDRAEAVKAALPPGIDVIFTLGLGQALPIADNSTPDGREQNRRVEVWQQR